LLKKPNSVNFNKNMPKLMLQGVLNGKPSAKLNVLNKDWLSTRKFEDQITKIEKFYNSIGNIKLPQPPTEEQIQTMTVADMEANNLNMDAILNDKTVDSILKSLNMYPIVIDEEIISLIETYANQNGIQLSTGFFYIASLKKSKNMLPAALGGGWSLSGSNNEKKKYSEIMELYDLIIEYKQLINYFSTLSSMPYIEICITNIGSTFDEDIDVYMKMSKGNCCILERLSVPGDEIVEQFTDNLIYLIYKPQQNVSINEYAYYPDSDDSMPVYSPTPPPLLFSKSRQNEIDDAREECSQIMDDLFCYDVYEDANYDILHFNLEYLKQNDSMFIPTYLHFNALPENIHYEIKSKFSPEVVEGILEF